MKIYLAARYSTHPEMQGVRDVLQAMGHEVTSRWIDLHNGDRPNSALAEELNGDPESLVKYALADLEDIDAADTFISFTKVGGGKGGRHIEFGYAWARGKRMIIVGPRENIFHTLPTIQHFDNWRQLAAWFSSEFWKENAST